MRVGVALLVALVLAGSAEAATRYRVASATASARLSFDSGDLISFARGSSELQLHVSRRSSVSLSPSGGRVVASLAGTKTERVRLGSRSDPSQPYLEDSCGTRRAVSTRGGIVLRRAGRRRLQLRWAFPHASSSFCPGPASAVLRALEPRMTSTISATQIGARRLVLRLNGRASAKGFKVLGKTGTATYSWRATITLVRT
jgi:hypothetical protein